ncbi:MAG: hypothetical protein LBK40_07815 [Spirochaetaceae bacterium]|jgi:hypothetical protein|nr:hypothetical protein [Spirochaetaceae bacterium]
MKPVRFFLVVLFVLALGGGLFAQANSNEQRSAGGISPGKESEYYYINVDIETIYPYRLGYLIIYRRGVNGIGRAYIPLTWFDDLAGKAKLVALGPGRAWPHLTVYYRNGEFSHCRLFVRREASHASWGNVPLNVNIDDRFEGVDTLELEF